jgi:two-component system response regulator BaeR
MKHHILIVEDEIKIAELVADYLKASDYQTEHIDNGNAVISRLKAQMPDLILLDLMLPGRDGLSLCQEIRTFSDVPIIMLTARVEEIDRILGLDLGADDYICKPFSPREVVSRVNALLRRVQRFQTKTTHIIETTVSEIGLSIDSDNYVAYFNAQALTLTPAEFRLLNILSHLPIRVYSRQQLIDQLYDDDRIVTNRTIDTHVKNLRKKLLDAGSEIDMICSIYGVGYRWNG